MFADREEGGSRKEEFEEYRMEEGFRREEVVRLEGSGEVSLWERTAPPSGRGGICEGAEEFGETGFTPADFDLVNDLLGHKEESLRRMEKI